MVSDKMTSLVEVLVNIEDIPWEYALYIPSSDLKWRPDMPVMVLDPEDTDEVDVDPDIAISNGLKYAISIGSLQDVVANIKMQKSSAGMDEVIKAVRHFYENDSFIAL